MVSRQVYYAWLRRRDLPPDPTETTIAAEIGTIHSKHQDAYGSPRITH